MKKNLTTPAGPDEAHAGDSHISALNQIFALYRRNYHNQYYRAFPNEKELSITKRLWLDSLRRFAPETLLRAAKSIIETSEFLPTLRTMIQHCEQRQEHGLPDTHSAYVEACRAPSPKANYNWSHPAVYYAGKNCDWYFINSSSEEAAYPVFKKEYEKICQQVFQGELFNKPKKVSLEKNLGKNLDKEENLKNLQSLKESLDLH